MAVERPAQLSIGVRSLPLPVYFPSVSSIKTSLRPQDYLQFLSSLVGLNGQFLVSAFDLANIEDPTSAGERLAVSRQAGAIILMDSGNYESYWKDAQADWKQEHFHKALKDFPCDLAFGFDEQSPPNDHKEHVDLIAKRWLADQEAAGSCLIIPIVHATAAELPALCAAIAAETGVTMLAVAERKLGDGILERARAVRAIRSEMDKLGRYVALHLLGTGNPISIAIYSAMGADSFDGLEWCQTVVDHDTALLYHLSQADFFVGQTAWGDAELSFQARTLAHNLEFFEDWMGRLCDAASQGRVLDFCRLNLPIRVFQHCANDAGWSLS
ncbi:hypothetical protein [Ralstonia syzygii]|uniref:Uncharacterized protein n=1 Tax=Ralstonia syzygii R24 TaxID=907261 RepID=G3A2B3_9RALS|nr:hypothetical protein [Ralstonia syzygii]CCA85546.1 conserved hypothetical protein [Ralstonia syzygii R24]